MSFWDTHLRVEVDDDLVSLRREAIRIKEAATTYKTEAGTSSDLWDTFYYIEQAAIRLARVLDKAREAIE